MLVSAVNCPESRRQSTHRGRARTQRWARTGNLVARAAAGWLLSRRSATDLSLAQVPMAITAEVESSAGVATAEEGGVVTALGRIDTTQTGECGDARVVTRWYWIPDPSASGVELPSRTAGTAAAAADTAAAGGDPAAAMDKDVAVAASEETVRQGAVTTGEVRVVVTTVYPVRWGQYTQEG